MRLLILALTAVLISPFAQADEPVRVTTDQNTPGGIHVLDVSPQVRQAEFELLTTVISRVGNMLGQLDVARLRDQLNSVRFYRMRTGQIPRQMQVDGRPDGVNFPDQRLVLLASTVSVATPLTSDQLAFLLHETLFVLGYNEQNYQISTAIIAGSPVMVVPEGGYQENELAPSVQELDRQPGVPRFTVLAGGATGVSGGGDELGLRIKRDIRAYAAHEPGSAAVACIRDVFEQMIEVEAYSHDRLLTEARARHASEVFGAYYTMDISGAVLLVDRDLYVSNSHYREVVALTSLQMIMEWSQLMSSFASSGGQVTMNPAAAASFSTLVTRGSCYDQAGAPTHIPVGPTTNHR